MFCTVGLSLNPGESFIVPPLPLQLVPSRLADAADAPSSVVADDTPTSTAAYASLRFTRFASSYLVRVPLTEPAYRFVNATAPPRLAVAKLGRRNRRKL
jgi:hypothetical protein